MNAYSDSPHTITVVDGVFSVVFYKDLVSGEVRKLSSSTIGDTRLSQRGFVKMRTMAKTVFKNMDKAAAKSNNKKPMRNPKHKPLFKITEILRQEVMSLPTRL